MDKLSLLRRYSLHHGWHSSDDEPVPDVPLTEIVGVSHNTPQSDIAYLVRESSFLL